MPAWKVPGWCRSSADVAEMDLRPAPRGHHPRVPCGGAPRPRGAGRGLAAGLRDERPGVGPSRRCLPRRRLRVLLDGLGLRLSGPAAHCARTTRRASTSGRTACPRSRGRQSCATPRRQTGSPLTIIRIFSTYGPEGGTPVNRLRRILRGEEVVLYPDAPNNYNPIYEDDYVRLAVRALEVAAPDPVVVNFAGSETVSAEDYCAYLGELVGRPVHDPLRPRRPLADLARRDPDARGPRPDRGALARGHAPGRRRHSADPDRRRWPRRARPRRRLIPYRGITVRAIGGPCGPATSTTRTRSRSACGG